ncbi:hypothetical protein OIE68_33215 [Nocardia vinacea]|uniref:Uncharacterized protein n=1 Tax=Nocardia vinacea TaxID=96468 RepID=A0ABZ1Z7Z0_9NOCA|nr:hypothetical protein OIE68_33215 [Nocardia vinacea]
MAGSRRKELARSAKLAGLPMGIMARRATATGRAIVTGVPRDELDDAVIDRAADEVFAVLGEFEGGTMQLGRALSVAEGAPRAGHARPGSSVASSGSARSSMRKGRSSSGSRDGCPASRAMTKRPR